MNMRFQNIYIIKEKRVLIFLEIHLIILVHLTQMLPLFITNHFLRNLYPSKNRNILLIDSGAQYLEGTTDITRVIKIGKKNFSKIKYSYTYLLKSLIKIENKIFPRNTRSSEIDLFIRNYLSKFKIYYSHGTGHGVGNFGDVHEKYPIISSKI